MHGLLHSLVLVYALLLAPVLGSNLQKKKETFEELSIRRSIRNPGGDIDRSQLVGQIPERQFHRLFAHDNVSVYVNPNNIASLEREENFVQWPEETYPDSSIMTSRASHPRQDDGLDVFNAKMNALEWIEREMTCSWLKNRQQKFDSNDHTGTTYTSSNLFPALVEYIKRRLASWNIAFTEVFAIELADTRNNSEILAVGSDKGKIVNMDSGVRYIQRAPTLLQWKTLPMKDNFNLALNEIYRDLDCIKPAPPIVSELLNWILLVDPTPDATMLTDRDAKTLVRYEFAYRTVNLQIEHGKRLLKFKLINDSWFKPLTEIIGSFRKMIFLSGPRSMNVLRVRSGCSSEFNDDSNDTKILMIEGMIYISVFIHILWEYHDRHTSSPKDLQKATQDLWRNLIACFDHDLDDRRLDELLVALGKIPNPLSKPLSNDANRFARVYLYYRLVECLLLAFLEVQEGDASAFLNSMSFKASSGHHVGREDHSYWFNGIQDNSPLRVASHLYAHVVMFAGRIDDDTSTSRLGISAFHGDVFTRYVSATDLIYKNLVSYAQKIFGIGDEPACEESMDGPHDNTPPPVYWWEK
jgi:hypothetical protein